MSRSKKSFPRSATLALLSAMTAGSLLLAGCAATTPEEPADTTAPTDLHALLPASIQESGVLRVGVTADPAPYSTKGEDGVQGFVPELAQAAGDLLGVDVEFVELPFPGLIPAIQADKADVGWTVLNDTVEREEVLDIVTYLNNSSAFLTLKGEADGITSLDELCGYTIATVRGSLYIPVLEEKSTACTADGDDAIVINQFDDGKASLLSVQSGNSDAFLGLTGVQRFLAANIDGGNSLEVAELQVFPGYLGVVMNKDTGLAQALEAALEALVEDGTYDEIAGKWTLADDVPSVDQVTVNGVGTGELK